jgi:uncharacterized protein
VAAGADLRLQSQRDQIPPLAHATSKGHSVAEVLSDAIEADKPSKRVANRRLLAAAAQRARSCRLRAAGGTHQHRCQSRERPRLDALLEVVILGDGSKRYQQIVTILLDAGADPQIADCHGVTALQHATRRGHDRVAGIIRNA